MDKFYIGDKVEVIGATNGWGSVVPGDIGAITSLCGDNRYFVDFEGKQSGWIGDESCFKLVKSCKENFMGNVVEKFKVSLLPEPEKTFRKLGIIDGDNMLTADGVTLMMNFLLDKHKKEFNELVVANLVEEEKK